MPLLENGRLAEDRFAAVADDAPLPSDTPALIPFARLQREAEALAGRNAALGIQVAPATPPEDIAPFLDRVSLVVVEFPKFRDGRGFSIGRALRERYGYQGEIRAVGHVLPDQHAFLLRCGFTAVAVPDGTDLAPWAAALGRFRVAYQAGMDAATPVSLLRRRMALSRALG